MNTYQPSLNECPLRYQAIHRPDGVAMMLDQQPVSFLVLAYWVEQCLHYYQSVGIKKNQHIAVITTDSLHTLVIALACLRGEWVFCPINPAFPALQKQQYAERIDASLVTHSAEIDFDPDITVRTKIEPIEINPEYVSHLIATSGTSGAPKAVAHCYRSHFVSAIGSAEKLPITISDSWLLSLPLFHVGGFAILVRCLLAGATIVCFRNKQPLHTMLQQVPVTHLSLVNTQLFRLLEQKIDFYQQGVRFILLGGGVASPLLVERVQHQGVKLLTTYGMTEMASQVCTGEPVFTGLGVTSGEVLPARELRLSNSGEILLRGDTLSPGYYQQGNLISLTDDKGWFHSGDKGQWHNSQLLVCGRIDNMLISGGENIHPEEVEQALLTLPEIVQAVVVSTPHHEFGCRPVAFVQTVDGLLNEIFIKKRLAGQIAKFKIPDSIWLFPAQAVSAGIKIDRRFFQQLVKAPV